MEFELVRAQMGWNYLLFNCLGIALEKLQGWHWKFSTVPRLISHKLTAEPLTALVICGAVEDEKGEALQPTPTGDCCWDWGTLSLKEVPFKHSSLQWEGGCGPPCP